MIICTHSFISVRPEFTFYVGSSNVVFFRNGKDKNETEAQIVNSFTQACLLLWISQKNSFILGLFAKTSHHEIQ